LVVMAILRGSFVKSVFVVCGVPTRAALEIGAQAHFGPSEKFTGANQELVAAK